MALDTRREERIMINNKLYMTAPSLRKIETAKAQLSSDEAGRSYAERLKYYRQVAFAMAENDPSGALKYAKEAKQQLGWN